MRLIVRKILMEVQEQIACKEAVRKLIKNGIWRRLLDFFLILHIHIVFSLFLLAHDVFFHPGNVIAFLGATSARLIKFSVGVTGRKFISGKDVNLTIRKAIL